MIVDEDEPATASEFLEFFRTDRFRPSHIYDADSWGLNGYIFRGQANSKWKLFPSCFRDNRLNDHTPQAPSVFPNDTAELKRYLGLQLHAELRAVFSFMETADKLGIKTPLNYANTREHAEIGQCSPQ